MDELNEGRKKKTSELRRLRYLLKDGVAEFVYKKSNGAKRNAKGTLNSTLIPKEAKDDKPTNDSNNEVFTYYDLKKDGWRRFRKENFIKIKE